MDTNPIFARRLKELREDKGLSQAQLADELNISRGSISYYENAERTPDINVLIVFKEYYQVDFDYLLGYSNIRNKDADTPVDVHPRMAACLKTVEKTWAESADTFIPGRFGPPFAELDYLCEDIVNLIKAYHSCLKSAYQFSMDEKITKEFLDNLSKNNTSAIITMGFRNAHRIPMNIKKPTKKNKGLFGR